MSRKILKADFTRKEELAVIGQINVEKSDFTESKDKKSVAFQQTITFDVNGEIIADVTRRKVFQNGRGFVISYTEKMCEFLCKVSTGSVVRVFLYLAHNQSYGADDKTFGYRCSHKHLQQVLNLDRSVIWDALKFLKENFLVCESKIDGQTEFMVNPNYVTIGRSKADRMREWNARWAKHWKNQNTK